VANIDRLALRLVRLIERASDKLSGAITGLADRGVRSRRIG
jgi:hypothetical protein